MNINNIFNLLHKTDPEVFDKISPRRHILKSFSSKVAVAAVPFALGSLFKKAYGQTTELEKITDALGFALTLEYLESAFYTKALATTDILYSSVIPSLTKIAADEAAHVAFLKNVITSLGRTPADSPMFDFTGGAGTGTGRYFDTFDHTVKVLQMAQMFEDLGVSAYKGQVHILMTDNVVLSAALKIHSVEARHAARIRIMRDDLNLALSKPWVIGDVNDLDDPGLSNIYDKEDNMVQMNITIPGINGYDVTAGDAREAFDEPLSREEVMEFVTPFLYPTP